MECRGRLLLAMGLVGCLGKLGLRQIYTQFRISLRAAAHSPSLLGITMSELLPLVVAGGLRQTHRVVVAVVGARKVRQRQLMGLLLWLLMLLAQEVSVAATEEEQ